MPLGLGFLPALCFLLSPYPKLQNILNVVDTTRIIRVNWFEHSRIGVEIASITAKLRKQARKYCRIFKPEVGCKSALRLDLHPAGLEPATL